MGGCLKTRRGAGMWTNLPLHTPHTYLLRVIIVLHRRRIHYLLEYIAVLDYHQESQFPVASMGGIHFIFVSLQYMVP